MQKKKDKSKHNKSMLKNHSQIEWGLQELERCSREILENLRFASVILDLNGNIGFCNDFLLGLTGWKREEIIGKEWFDIFIPAELKDEVRTIFSELIKSGNIYPYHINNILTRDGNQRLIKWNNIVLRNEDGNIFGIASIGEDITEHRSTENSLKESEEKYRNVVENANEIIAIIQDEMIKYANPKVFEVTGYSEKELSSINPFDVVYPNDRNLVYNNYNKIMNGEKILQNYSLRIVNKSGNIRWLELNALIISWLGETAILCFANDVTDKKRMEEEILRIQKLESIGILAGGIAHDFNNLLTGILGNISLARMFLDPKEKAYTRLIEAEKASNQARNLTQQLLTFSRNDSQMLKIMSIDNLIKESASFARRGSNVKCKFDIPDDLWYTQIDESQISQVINNIVINAEKSMPSGGLITIKAENIDTNKSDNIFLEDEKYIKITISDQGSGIPEEHLQKIFDPYFTTKQRENGLGLSVCFSIIKKHHGHIEVESKIGLGTTFYIYLPAISENNTLDMEESIYGIGNVLVMDDESIIRELACEMLVNLGYKATTASDGYEAINLYKKAKNSRNPFVVVILDLTVSNGMNGLETIKKLLEIDPEVKAILSSGYLNNPVMANFSEYGFKGIIEKPYKVKDLSKILHKIIHEKTA